MLPRPSKWQRGASDALRCHHSVPNRCGALEGRAAALAKPRPVTVTSVPPLVGPPSIEILYTAAAYMTDTQADNKKFEIDADSVLDFTEGNPFGDNP